MNIELLTQEAERMGVRIRERPLSDPTCAGVYCAHGRLIVINEGLSDEQKRCTLAHELAHARHNDPGCGSPYGAKAERRARRETALQLISPIEYAAAEQAYDGDPFLIAQALGVTAQVIDDYRDMLHDTMTPRKTTP